MNTATTLTDAAIWHRQEAGHCRYAAAMTAMDKPALVKEALTRKAEMHEAFAQAIEASPKELAGDRETLVGLPFSEAKARIYNLSEDDAKAVAISMLIQHRIGSKYATSKGQT